MSKILLPILIILILIIILFIYCAIILSKRTDTTSYKDHNN